MVVSPSSILQMRRTTLTLTDDEIKSLESVVHYAARQAAGSMLEYDDARQVAWLAIVESYDAFDASKASLRTYAQRIAVGAVLDAANGLSSSMAVPSRTVKRYRQAIRVYGSAAAAFDYCTEFDMTPQTFYHTHVALTGCRSFDAPLAVENDYTGDIEEVASLEAFTPTEWLNMPDVSVWDVIDTLSDKQREAVELYAVGMTTVDIGKRLGISQQNAHKHIVNALNNLRDFYAQGGVN